MCVTFFLSDAPEFTHHPENIVQFEGKYVVFNCSVDGNPRPSIQWTKDSKRLNITADPKLSTSSSGNSHSLTITDVHRSDEGKYRCEVNNIVDTTTSLAGTLEVHCEYAFNFRIGLTSGNISTHRRRIAKIKNPKVAFAERNFRFLSALQTSQVHP